GRTLDDPSTLPDGVQNTLYFMNREARINGKKRARRGSGSRKRRRDGPGEKRCLVEEHDSRLREGTTHSRRSTVAPLLYPSPSFAPLRSVTWARASRRTALRSSTRAGVENSLFHGASRIPRLASPGGILLVTDGQSLMYFEPSAPGGLQTSLVRGLYRLGGR